MIANKIYIKPMLKFSGEAGVICCKTGGQHIVLMKVRKAQKKRPFAINRH